ncbi:hypothetical protein DL89DRAFT_56900, partial [Linderina pennispora]
MASPCQPVGAPAQPLPSPHPRHHRHHRQPHLRQPPATARIMVETEREARDNTMHNRLWSPLPNNPSRLVPAMPAPSSASLVPAAPASAPPLPPPPASVPMRQSPSFSGSSTSNSGGLQSLMEAAEISPPLKAIKHHDPQPAPLLPADQQSMQLVREELQRECARLKALLDRSTSLLESMDRSAGSAQPPAQPSACPAGCATSSRADQYRLVYCADDSQILKIAVSTIFDVRSRLRFGQIHAEGDQCGDGVFRTSNGIRDRNMAMCQ